MIKNRIFLTCLCTALAAQAVLAAERTKKTAVEVARAETALLDAASKGNMESAKNALKAGANVNAKNKQGETALGLATFNGHIELVREAACKGGRCQCQK
jgi:ankyrin repeat protein